MPAEFHPAFLAAALEWFIPERFWCQSGEGDEGVVVNRACDPDRWLSVVSADRPLVTQFDDVATAWPEIGSARPVRDVHIGQLPYSWVERTVPGGVIVAPMRADVPTGPLVRSVVGEDGTATGRAVDWLKVSFMDMRGERRDGRDECCDGRSDGDQSG